EWTAIFGDVLFPLITQLLKPEVYQSDAQGMAETRVQAATLLCKIFLNYMVLLAEWDGMVGLWLGIVDVLERLMRSGQGGGMEESVEEGVKNVLLVMSAQGILKLPKGEGEDGDQEGDGGELWDKTWARLDRFLPGLMQELFPKEAEKAKERPKGEPRPVAVDQEKLPERRAEKDVEEDVGREAEKMAEKKEAEESKEGNVN
ncbi:hypothetical protein LTS18_010233, partial [Coniosporium uncinatum]